MSLRSPAPHRSATPLTFRLASPRQLKLALDKISRCVWAIRVISIMYMNNPFVDMQCVERCDDPNPANHVTYEQPVWQSLNMFLGELGCSYHPSPSDRTRPSDVCLARRFHPRALRPRCHPVENVPVPARPQSRRSSRRPFAPSRAADDEAPREIPPRHQDSPYVAACALRFIRYNRAYLRLSLLFFSFFSLSPPSCPSSALAILRLRTSSA
jgi:hypothetical protein